jgi:hypothetical protein
MKYFHFLFKFNFFFESGWFSPVGTVTVPATVTMERSTISAAVRRDIFHSHSRRWCGGAARGHCK